MMEYIFFDENLRDRFAEFVRSLALICKLQDDNMGMLVMVSDELGEELNNKLEEYYEQLQDEQAQLLSEVEGGFKNLAGFSLVMPDGTMSTVPLQPDVANRLLSYFTLDEIQALFSTVARCALEPKESHLCKILRGNDNAN